MATDENIRAIDAEELHAAWRALANARASQLSTAATRAEAKALLVTECRDAAEASGKRVTTDQVNAYYLAHPAYISAVNAANDAEVTYLRALGTLERLWLLHGMPGQRLGSVEW